MKHVYVAGPISAPTPELVLRNVERALDVGNRLLDAGLWPHVPHLTYYLDLRKPRHYETWMAVDLAVLRRMDALLRMEEASPGADREVGWAKVLGMPVFWTETEVIAWAKAAARKSR